MANTSPGTDFPTWFETLLSQTEGQWCNDAADDISDDAEEDDVDGYSLGSPTRVTVREVLKYSRSCVIIPSVTVQAWIQEIELLGSQPSTRTVEPKDVIDWGTNWKDWPLDEAPVRRRIRNWWDGGPWNHHSRSGARIWWTVFTLRELKASYRARTTLWLLESSSSRIPWELASSCRSFCLSLSLGLLKDFFFFFFPMNYEEEGEEMKAERNTGWDFTSLERGIYREKHMGTSNCLRPHPFCWFTRGQSKCTTNITLGILVIWVSFGRATWRVLIREYGFVLCRAMQGSVCESKRSTNGEWSSQLRLTWFMLMRLRYATLY